MENISEIINSQAEGIVKALKMPEVRTTTVEKERGKKKTKRKFNTRVFAILDDYSAEEYSSFIDSIINEPESMTVMREVENWTKDGELIRVVDYIEEVPV